ncbi:tyrosine-protein phosphatase non-receptor type 61F isoform X1 [Scaptodrosophila lebanonensis]|uniref:protein-tyrosine-phosphatase n=1 Tax=Drosophila lebanonensis TaxID=7225 RepID=A0A6J2UAS1_DROLE|nr:tyrosine-protein phosphatase non-receptor type 61F isoform X1 [Scaptodrosophila lebanonensis]
MSEPINSSTTDDNREPKRDNAVARQAIENEYKLMITKGWLLYYKDIAQTCDRKAKEKNFTTQESERPQNRPLNRYRDVSPYDHSRIVLKRGNVDYINANLVKLVDANREYILTQGPLVDTVGHFWLMVWEQNSRGVLMLNKLIEKKHVKCHLYWPDQMGAGNALKLDDVKLTVELVRLETYKNFVRRWFKLTDLETQTSREVLQFHYTTWPDFGLPSSPDAFLKFLQVVRASGALNNDVGPAVVHCSAGIGRSGTFCLVDCCLVLVDKYGECNVSEVLIELRSYRMGLIQTADQLDFSYKAIIEGITKLKDPTFLNEEEKILSNDTDTHTLLQDEMPPPLPPRTDSLNLPLAPSAGGVLSLNMRAAQADKSLLSNGEVDDNIGDKASPTLISKDGLNNIINRHEIVNAEAIDSLSTDRPLPPLPPGQKSHVQGSDSDNDDDDYDMDDIEDDDEDEDTDEAFKNINADNAKDSNCTLLSNTDDDVNANNEKASEQHEQLCKTNGIDAPHNPASPDNELKRRKRTEYQANLEQKVNDIKRKQRENEDNQQAAKKRRSLIKYIAAGVVVGVICAYAYTKLT